MTSAGKERSISVIIMASEPPTEFFPRDADALADDHMEVAHNLVPGLRKVGEAFALHFGEAATQAALTALLVESSYPVDQREKRCAHINRVGWRKHLADDLDAAQEIDAVNLTQFMRNFVAYAGQGLAPDERCDNVPSLPDRRKRVQTLIKTALIASTCLSSLYGNRRDYVWKGVAARAALDFNEPVPVDGLQLLPGVSAAAVRNAISSGALHPDEDGNLPCQEAKAWLARRRGFQPSRWQDLKDDQWPFDPTKAATPNDKGMILVPQSADGEPFMPRLVVRNSQNGAGISITIGAKGEEVQYHDFYQALAALANMNVPRWRRRNGAGNWGIVRARGAWVTVNKAEIDRQLVGTPSSPSDGL